MMDLNKFKTLTVLALARISAAGERGVPAGHLYAELMPHCTLEEFEAVVSNLTNSCYVRRSSGHLLTITAVGLHLGKECEAAVKAA